MIEKYELTGVAANIDSKKFMGNPVNSFLVIKLLTQDLQMFFDLFNSVQESKGLKNFEHGHTNSYNPLLILLKRVHGYAKKRAVDAR